MFGKGRGFEKSIPIKREDIVPKFQHEMDAFTYAIRHTHSTSASTAGSLTMDAIKQARAKNEEYFWHGQWCTNDDDCTSCFASSPDVNRTIDSIIKDYQKAIKNHGDVKGRVAFIAGLRPVERVRFDAWVACEEQIAKKHGTPEVK